MLLGACSEKKEAGLAADGRAAIARFGEALDELHDAASLTGGSGPPEQVAPVADDGVATGATFALDRIAEARRDVLISVLGDSGPAAVLRAVVLEIASARRRIAELAGAAPDGPGRFSLPPPAKVIVLTDVTEEQIADGVEQLKLRRGDFGFERLVIRGFIDAGLFALASEALLADPGARARLAPKLSPDDIPEVTPELANQLGLGGTTRRIWQEAVFDGEGRLVLTPAEDGRYT
ncbi:MAG: hypothetical protein ACRECM_06515, partial [Methyloceanibacter sp.]